MAIYLSPDVASPAAAYPAANAPQITCPFEPRRIIITNEDGNAAHEAYISFDGVNDHAVVIGGSQTILEYQHATKVWVRSPGGLASFVNICFEA